MAATEPEYGNCQACKTPLQYLGLEQFRIGGTSGAAKLFFGELAELGEHASPLPFPLPLLPSG